MTRVQFIRSRLLAPPPRRQTAVLYTVLAVAVPSLIRALIDGLASENTFGAYYPFVLLSGMFLGWRLAAVATLASAVVANFLFMRPRHTFFANFEDTTGAISFIVSSILIIAMAETLRRAAQEVEASRKHEAHLNLELQHRVKNTLAVIQGLATQTFRDPGSKGDLQKFHGRLRALAEAHAILSSGRWEECQLPQLAVRALEPFNSKAGINLYGPRCSLPEESCVPLVLALHELATNAVKYGALSTPGGTVDLAWALIPAAGSDGQNLILDWTERDGPAVQSPTRRGLGSRLLRPQPGIENVELAFLPLGLNCRFHISGANVVPISAGTPELAVPAAIYSTAKPERAARDGP